MKTFLDSCPEMLYIPNYPILFGDVYFACKKKSFTRNAQFQAILNFIYAIISFSL